MNDREGCIERLPIKEEPAVNQQEPARVFDTLSLNEKPKATTGQLQRKQNETTELPFWLDREAWDGFEDLRRKLKKPLTERARKLAIEELRKLREQGNDPTVVLNQSVMQGWLGLFPVRKEETKPWQRPNEIIPFKAVNALEKQQRQMEQGGAA